MKIKVDYNQIYEQLDNLLNSAPCHGKECIGYQRCVYGIDGCDGSKCAIEEVLTGMLYQRIEEESK